MASAHGAFCCFSQFANFYTDNFIRGHYACSVDQHPILYNDNITSRESSLTATMKLKEENSVENRIQ